MRYNSNYVLKKLAGETILVYQSEEQVNFSKIITVNELGEIIILGLQIGKEKEEILNLILSTYEVDAVVASNDYDEFVAKLIEIGGVIDA